MHLPGLDLGTTFCTCVFLTLVMGSRPLWFVLRSRPLMQIKKKKNTSDAKVWEPEMRKKAAVQKRQCSTLARRKQEGLMGLIQSQSIYKRGRVVESEPWWIRRWSWECICRWEKAVVPSGITFPKGERGLSVMRFKLIPTIASAPEAFSNSKQTLCKENFICKNTFWLHGIP